LAGKLFGPIIPGIDWVEVGEAVSDAVVSAAAAVGTTAVLTVTGAGRTVAAVVGGVVGEAAVVFSRVGGVFVEGISGSFPQAAMKKRRANKHSRDKRRECPICSLFIF
jgi:hypothetical protein